MAFRLKIYSVSFILQIISVLSFSQVISKEKQIGNLFFCKDTVHEIKIYINQCNAWDSLIKYKNDTLNQFIQANISIDKKMYYSVGCRLKGESSFDFYPGHKKSIKIKFNKYIKKQKLDGLSNLNLNNGFKDPTLMREKLFFDFLRKERVPAPRCTYSNIYLNNEYLGLYCICEQINQDFYSNNFGNRDGNSYKGDPMATFQYLGENAEIYYPKYSKESNSAANNWIDLLTFIKTLNDSISSDEVYKTNLDKIFNVENCIKIWVITNFFVNVDAYNLLYPHNFYLYKNTSTGKFEWIPYDANYAFAAWTPIFSEQQATNLSILYLPIQINQRPLLKRIMNNKIYKAFYITYAKQLLKTSFTQENINKEIDKLAFLIRKDIYPDKAKMYSNDNFETNIDKTIGDVNDPGNFIPGLKSFITKRIIFLNKELKNL